MSAHAVSRTMCSQMGISQRVGGFDGVSVFRFFVAGGEAAEDAGIATGARVWYGWRMGDISPQQFFRFAADHADLLQDLHRAHDLSEGEIYGFIRKHADHSSPAATHTFNRLLELGILDAAPDATARYELTRPVATLMRYLLRQYRLTSIAVIQSYFTALEQQTNQLEAAQHDPNPDLWMRVAFELAEHLEDMRHDSHNNRNGVIARVMQIKTAKEGMTPAARYAEVNRLWNTYVIPLRDMIDSRKLLDVTLQRARLVLKDAAQTVGVGRREIVQRAEELQSRLVRLRRDVLNDFEESLREIAPLYEELRRENALARGASAIIERMMKKGVGSLKVPSLLGIPNWQMQGQFSDAALEAHIARITDYSPQPPQPIVAEGAAGRVRQPFDVRAFEVLVRESLPIDDGLKWLVEQYPEEPPATILRLYGRFYGAQYGFTVFHGERREYRILQRRFRACPMRIQPLKAKESHVTA